MDYRLLKTRLHDLVIHRNGYLMLAGASMLMNLLLMITVMLLLGREKIVMIPPRVSQTFWVNSSQVSPEYLSEMTQFLVGLRLNVTPGNAAMQHELLLRYVDSKLYGELRRQLALETERMSKEHIALAFYVSDIKVDSKRMISHVTGDLVATIGTDVQPAKRINDELHFTWNNGRLLVNAFKKLDDSGKENHV